MEKYFDAKDMRNVIDDIEWLFSGYREHSDGLISCYEKYRDNELFQGELAEASKQFIDKRQITQAKAQVAMQQKLLGMYKHALSSFHEKVDKAPDARVDLETLDMVNRDLQEIYADLDEYVRYIEKVVKLLQARYGFLGIFTMPNFQPALDTFTALCGGDNPRSGFIYDLKQKFINFDADECAYADSLNFEQEIDDANDKIQAATNLLEGYVTPGTKSKTESTKKVTKKETEKKLSEVEQQRQEQLEIRRRQREEKNSELKEKGIDGEYYTIYEGLTEEQRKYIDKIDKLDVTNEKKISMRCAALLLFKKGMDKAFITGVLANIASEGSPGKFENSNYDSNPAAEPAYLKALDEHFEYRNTMSSKTLSEIGIDETIAYLERVNAHDGEYEYYNPNKGKKEYVDLKFGIGAIQWTDDGRVSNLMNLYKERASSNNPSSTECAQIEAEFLVQELMGDYGDIYTSWKESSGDAGSAAYDICMDYERPSEKKKKAEARQGTAKEYYEILMGD